MMTVFTNVVSQFQRRIRQTNFKIFWPMAWGITKCLLICRKLMLQNAEFMKTTVPWNYMQNVQNSRFRWLVKMPWDIKKGGRKKDHMMLATLKYHLRDSKIPSWIWIALSLNPPKSTFWSQTMMKSQFHKTNKVAAFVFYSKQWKKAKSQIKNKIVIKQNYKKATKGKTTKMTPMKNQNKTS